jgi:hypothetical protein
LDAGADKGCSDERGDGGENYEESQGEQGGATFSELHISDTGADDQGLGGNLFRERGDEFISGEIVEGVVEGHEDGEKDVSGDLKGG